MIVTISLLINYFDRNSLFYSFRSFVENQDEIDTLIQSKALFAFDQYSKTVRQLVVKVHRNLKFEIRKSRTHS